MVTLYDQFGRKIEKAKKPERTPLPVAPILESQRNYVADGITPERLAILFKDADQGRIDSQAELFDQLEERDGHLLAERDKRKNTILANTFKLEPASEEARDIKVMEFVQDFIDNEAEWDDVIVSMQDAVGKGYACHELHWDVSEGQAVPEKFEFIEQRRFTFVDESGLKARFPRLLTDNDSMGGEIPAWRIMMHRYGGMSGHPVSSGIYRVASWMVLFKHYAIKDWLTFSELFGMPLRLGKYKSGATEDERRALEQAVRSLGSDAAGVISDQTLIEFIETSSTTSTDLWKQLASFCNAEMSKAILGGTLTTEVDGKGSYAAANTHNDVRIDLLDADGRAIASTVRNQLIKPLVGFNFGWDTLLPKYSSKYAAREDLEKKANWVEKVISKVAVPVSWLRREFNIPEQDGDEEMVGGPSSQTIMTAKEQVVVAKDGMRFTDEQQALEDLTEHAVVGVDLQANEELFIRIVEESGSYEEAMEKVLELYPTLEMDSLQQMLEGSFLAAEMHGRRLA